MISVNIFLFPSLFLFLVVLPPFGSASSIYFFLLLLEHSLCLLKRKKKDKEEINYFYVDIKIRIIATNYTV